MKQYLPLFLISTMIIIYAVSCGKSSETGTDASNPSDQLIHITQKQIEYEGIKIGEASVVSFDDMVKCNGYIMAPSNGIAHINTPISGIVASIRCVQGDYVKKGDILCLITSNEMVALQQEYGESCARLKRYKSDFERTKALYEQEIGAEKEFLAAESDYKAMFAKCQALKMRLELLRLNVTDIENGKLSSSFPLVAPISGYVTNMDMILGQMTEQQKALIEIVDVSLLQLELSVFEKDITKLKVGQPVYFSSIGDEAGKCTAKITTIGRTINQESKTVECIAKISDNNNNTFINRSYVEATIVVNSREAKALPSEAILKSGKDNFVFIVEKPDNDGLLIRRISVDIGNNFNGFTEIVGGDLTGKILLKGVYNLRPE